LSKPILVLAVETTSATGSLSVARLENHKISLLATRRWQKKSTHSEVITLELLQALKISQIDLESLTHLAVDVGPGSFTGIRVGLNLIRSLAYSLELPTRVFTSLEVLAYQVLRPGEKGVVAIPAIQNYFYAGVYDRKAEQIETIAPAESLDPDAIEKLKHASGVEKLIFPNEAPKSETLTHLFAHDFKNSKFLPWKEVLPLYIRRSEAEEKLRKGLLKPIA
jgi:tRNA threonylcarbamoyladenosine biosynthesis protein TsaB